MNAQVNFLEQLKKQLKFLETSCELYDSGNLDEGVRIATIIRVLVHNTSSSTSLLRHLNSTTINLATSVIDQPEQVSSYMGMGAIHSDRGHISFVPNLGLLPLAGYIPVSKWWDQTVMIIDKGLRISRRRLVLGAANKDGGAHVDVQLNNDYEALARDGVMGIIHTVSGGIETNTPITGTHLMSLRQIAYELLNSPELLKLANYSIQPKAIASKSQSTISIRLLSQEAITADSRNEHDKAYDLWCALVELDSSDSNSHLHAGISASKLGLQNFGNESDRWYDRAEKHYFDALRLNPALAVAHYNWGLDFAARAKSVCRTSHKTSIEFLHRAGEKFQLAIKIIPHMHEAHSDYGRVLDEEACSIVQTDPVRAHLLWQQAYENFQNSLNINPTNPTAFLNWGAALIHEAQEIYKSKFDVARILLQQSYEKSRKAILADPTNYLAYGNWGVALSFEARIVSAINLLEARNLWQLAGEKYRQALSINPNFHDLAKNWGIALIDESRALAKSNTDDSDKLLVSAEKLLLEHANFSPELISYSLARIYGMRGDLTSCLNWLNICQFNNALPNCSKLVSDPDFDSIRSTSEFAQWILKACPSN